MKDKKAFAGFVVLLALPLLACITTFSALSDSLRGEVILYNFAINMPMCLLLGYIDYRIVSCLLKKRHTLTLPAALLPILVADMVVGGLSAAYLQVDAAVRHSDPHLLRQILPVLLWNSIVVLIVELLFWSKKLLENKVRLATSEKEKAQYQFEALKNQINPHFLFNSLNVLSALTYQDAGKANQFAKKLSSVYRYLLSTQEKMEVPLQDELDFVESYIYLERIRFGETLHIRIDCDRQALGRNIVPASIQMLVENALKHNVNTAQSPLEITIRIDKERATVSNNIQLRTSVGQSRVGLKNLEAQYRIHHRHIEITKSDDTFTVSVPLL